MMWMCVRRPVAVCMCVRVPRCVYMCISVSRGVYGFACAVMRSERASVQPLFPHIYITIRKRQKIVRSKKEKKTKKSPFCSRPKFASTFPQIYTTITIRVRTNCAFLTLYNQLFLSWNGWYPLLTILYFLCKFFSDEVGCWSCANVSIYTVTGNHHIDSQTGFFKSNIREILVLGYKYFS